MRSATELKRRIVVGSFVKIVFHHLDHSGAMGLLGTIRRVERVQTNAIAVQSAKSPNGLSWLYWPPAKRIRIDSPDQFSILDETTSQPRMTYLVFDDDAEAMRAAVLSERPDAEDDVCMAGEPGFGGYCGDRGCICGGIPHAMRAFVHA